MVGFPLGDWTSGKLGADKGEVARVEYANITGVAIGRAEKGSPGKPREVLKRK